MEKAKVFKEEFLRANTGKNTKTLNLNTMRLGVNSIIALSNVLQSREVLLSSSQKSLIFKKDRSFEFSRQFNLRLWDECNKKHYQPHLC